MVVTRKKLRSFKLSSLAQRWQDKQDNLQKFLSPRKPTKAKSLISKKVRKIVKKEQQKKTEDIFDKKALKTSLVETLNRKKTIRKTVENPIQEKQAIKESTPKKRERRLKHSIPFTKSQKMDSSVKFFKCTDCEFTTVNPNHFARHIKRQIITCSRCNFKTDLRCILHAHNEVCGETESRVKPVYGKNLKIIAEKGPVYFCDFCRFLSKERFEIVEHVKNMHKISTTSELYQCSCCDFETVLKDNLSLHYVHRHKMQPENVKYIADRCLKNSKADSTETESSENLGKRKKNLQERKAEYLKNHLNTGIKRGAMNREGKENKKRLYIERQLEYLKEAEQKEMKQKLENVDCLSETSENDLASENSYSDQSDDSEIAETIRVFFQDKAIEISLKKSTSSSNSSTANRKFIDVERN